MDLIFSSVFWFTVIRATTPVLLAALGSCIVRKAGVVNLALEGTMLISAFVGVVASAFSQSLIIGMLFGVASGISVSLLLAYFSFSLKSEIQITGIAINLAAAGGTVFALYAITGDRGISSALRSLNYPTINLPFIKLIPYAGEFLHGVFSGHNFLTYFALIMVAVVYLFIYKTPLGIKIRAVGESPEAASSVGINVYGIKTIALILCGILTAFGGMFLSMGYLSMFSAEMTAGRGFIALAANNMAAGNPLGATVAAFVYGVSLSLANNLQNQSIPLELLYMFPYVFIITVFMIFSYRKRIKNKESQSF